METKINLADYSHAIKTADGEYYGFYNGPRNFEGYAAIFREAVSLVAFGANLHNNPTMIHLLDRTPYLRETDHYILVAYPAHLFDADSAKNVRIE